VSDFVFADTHAHLYLEEFSSDVDDVIARGCEQGVSRILIPGIDLETSLLAIKLAEKYPFVYAAVGIHPNSNLQWDKTIAKQLASMAGHEKVVAIGEIGLDAYRTPENIPQQKKVLLEQLEIAASYYKPIIIHSRNSIADVIELLINWKIELDNDNNLLSQFPGVVHTFEGDAHQAEILTKYHYCIGVGGQITHKNHTNLNEIVTNGCFDNIITETDCPFLTPHPHRGKRNEPAYIKLIVDRIAEIKNIDHHQASKVLYQNANRLFHWSY
jgi:TatD DNase family protein